MKRFIFNSLLDAENICNLEAEAKKISDGIQNGLKMLIYGKRNSGKTSLIRNVIAKKWQKEVDGFFMYVDLMGVQDISQISERMMLAFSQAYNKTFRMKSLFQTLLQTIKGIKPTLEVDEQGYPKLSFGVQTESKYRPFTDIIQQLDNLFSAKVSVLLVLDEFQDVALVRQAEALFRQSLESINSEIPVLILGSKQHLLTQIFAKPDAPFFSWGTHVSFLPIDYTVYSDYMNERFNQMNLNIDYDNAKYLQDLMSRNPEAINRLCYTLQHIGNKAEITKDNIDVALEQLIQDRRSEPESYLSKFSMAEQSVMTALAFKEPVSKPLGKVFVQQVGLSTTGVGKIIKKLENKAVVYKEDNGYVLADPLLKQHILQFRLR